MNENIININLIIDYMEKNNLSKREFAKKCRIPISVLLKILNQNTDFPIHYLFKIAKTLNIPIHQIFTD